MLIEIARKSTKIPNYKLMNAIPYIMEDGYKQRVLPKKYEKWHTIYIKLLKKHGNHKNSIGYEKAKIVK